MTLLDLGTMTAAGNGRMSPRLMMGFRLLRHVR